MHALGFYFTDQGSCMTYHIQGHGIIKKKEQEKKEQEKKEQEKKRKEKKKKRKGKERKEKERT